MVPPLETIAVTAASISGAGSECTIRASHASSSATRTASLEASASRSRRVAVEPKRSSRSMARLVIADALSRSGR